MIGWLTDWLAGWLIGWLAGWLSVFPFRNSLYITHHCTHILVHKYTYNPPSCFHFYPHHAFRKCNLVLCEAFHDHWFALRDEMERKAGMDLSYRIPLEKTKHKRSFGMCKGYDQPSHYLPLPIDTTKTMPYAV